MASNLRNHSVSFAEANSIFYDAFALTGADPDHSDAVGLTQFEVIARETGAVLKTAPVWEVRKSYAEERFITFGMSGNGKLLVVSYTERGDRIRIISARAATRLERKLYEDG